MNRFIARYRFLPLLAVALFVVGCGGADVPKTADQAVLRVVNGLAENKPVVVWDFLPESYQKDVHEIVHSAIAKVDAGLYDQSVALGQRVAKLLKDKKTFILGNPTVSQMLPNKAELEKQWDPIVGVLDTILNSELAKHETAKNINLGSFLDKTGSKVMADIANAAKLAGGGEKPGEANEIVQVYEKAKKIKATLVKEDGDKATVKLESPDEKTPKELEFVRIEGKWIPKEMADTWKKNIDEAKKSIAEMKPEEMKKIKEQAIPMIGMVEGLMGTLEKANTQEDFDAALAGLMQLMGGK
jgi:hypothetical protein